MHLNYSMAKNLIPIAPNMPTYLEIVKKESHGQVVNRRIDPGVYGV